MPAPHQPPDAPVAAAPITLQILSVIIFTFLCYLSIGLPLAVVPGYVHQDLGYSSLIAGLAISIQYFATLVTRPLAGRLIDTLGAKKTVQRGLIASLCSGVLLILAALAQTLPLPGPLYGPLLSLALLIVSRLGMGCAESFCSTGSIMWGIGRVGHANNASVISWNGVGTYGALAIGAPLGVVIDQWLGFVGLGVSVTALALLGLALAAPKAPAPVAQGERMPFSSVFSRVLPHGLGLALGSVGFGALATFVTLFYASRQWPHAALSLTVFGTLFVGTRLLFASAIRTHGGFRVAIASFLAEGAGLALIWQAGTPQMALVGAALTGLGFALVFPALGVEAVALVPPASRGAALSAYSVFLDLSLGITGPVAGLIASDFGYPTVYLFAAVAAFLAAALAVLLAHRAGGGLRRRTTI
ncbi:MAG: MFS transporter [Janthinobacterium lividum]